MARGMTDYERIEADPTQRAALRAEDLLLAASCAIAEEMERQGLTKAALAGRMGRSRGHVTQLLSGRNLTLRTLAEVADALGCKVQLSIAPARGPRRRAAS
jgi:antitoxin HicB